ncbi:transglycosylase domain-containing protein [Belnapia sp. T6]|uniref:peptidoglycan glycosyltransferase n=1 Tax=Belnapia mucosa TaxID=2804532 RepID=A0ABS1UYP9_9PROT|nr:transglycosylase domain-containing protein [Belnapia mucosa]MBL6454592.1 transglycosylase domain-containing protein [Belnapia mucosa]
MAADGMPPLERRRLLAFAGLSAVAASVPAPAVALELADPQKLVIDNREPGVRIIGSRGEFVAARGAYYAPPVPFQQLPPHLINALVASEDRRFREHFGIDPQALARALLSTLTGRTQGGSTLTQQTLKEVYLKHTNVLVRKALAEPVLAPLLELNLGKEDILFVYLNRVYFGGGAYGIEAAARVYFGKAARDLSVLEAAVLVSLLPAPNRFNPHRNPDLARDRGVRVVEQMAEQGLLARTEADAAKGYRLIVAPSRSAWGGFHPGGTQVGWFARWAEAEADAVSGERSGTRTILTTLDYRIQKAAERHLGAALDRYGQQRKVEEGAVVVMRPDGAVVAMVGGRDYRAKEWNHAMQARRQPGSVAKLFVYLAALERGLTPRQRVSDDRLSVGGRPVRNFDDRYFGEVALDAALARSSNTAAVRLASGHLGEVRDIARRLGIRADLSGEAGDLALGTYETTLLDLTAAYAALANRGMRVTPYCVRELRGNEGQRVEVRAEQPREPVIRPQQLQQMRRMLVGVVQGGTGRAANPGVWAAGKTGTTSEHRDAWFIGFTERYVAGVWLGNTSAATPMDGVTGGGLPAQIWRAVIMEAIRG